MATKEMSSRLNLVALMGKNDGWKKWGATRAKMSLNPMKDVDKTMFGKSREIESLKITRLSELSGNSGKTRQKRLFNIFWAASVGGGCHIYHP
ncbi:MAG: hypothetical protein IJK42_15975 [Prevotella sp.]|nr:hypothetical protein [Prevotella sp.]MBQ6211242.1 hypothetical protein [Prevotella sp.]